VFAVTRIDRPPGNVTGAERRGGRVGFARLMLGLAAASVLCVGLVDLRVRSGDDSFRFLDWNLFLAWVPMGFALAAYACARRRIHVLAALFGLAWLLFFPNAPYLLTDFIHLQESAQTPLWYEGLMLSAFAWTALLVGFVSLYLMHAIVRHGAGVFAGWLGVVVALALASVGVYLGRYIGLNSWDALLHPGRVAHVIEAHLRDPLHRPRLAESLVVLTSFLTVAYIVFASAAGLQTQVERDWAAAGARRGARP
jgi:uncharacterized membrane protein